MKTNGFSRFNADDYAAAPDWFVTFLDNINGIIDVLNPMLSNNIDIDNNLLAERQSVTITHNVPLKIKLRSLRRQPSLVRLGYAKGYIGVPAITAYNTDGTFYVTVFFIGTVPTTAIATTLVFEP